MHWPRSAPPCIEPFGRRRPGNTGLFDDIAYGYRNG